MSIENGVTSVPKRLSPHGAGIDAGIPSDYASREIQVLETRYFEVLGRLRRMEAPKANLTKKEIKRLRVIPGGRSTHRDAMLAEMKWMANDFHGERRWKRNANLQISDAVAKYHLKNTNKRRRVVVASNNKSSYGHVQRDATTLTRTRDSMSVSDALSVAETVREEALHNVKDEEESKYQNVPKPQRIVASWLRNLQSHGLGACLLRSNTESLSLRSEEIVCVYFRDLKQDSPHLVVLRDSTQINTWQTLLRRLCPKLSVSVVKSSSDTLFVNTHDVVLVVESCLEEDKRIRHANWHTVVFHEPSILCMNETKKFSATRFDRLYEVAAQSLNSILLTHPLESVEIMTKSETPTESTIRMALLFPRLFASGTSLEVSKRIAKWYESEGSSSSKSKKKKGKSSSLLERIFAVLEIRGDDLGLPETSPRHVLVSCPLSTQQCRRFPSLMRKSDSKSLVSNLTSLRRLSNCPSSSLRIRSSFVQPECVKLRVPDLRSKSKTADLSFLGLAFTHHENRNASIFSQRLHVYSSSSRSFMIQPNQERRVSTVSTSTKASMRLMPRSLVAEISSPPQYVNKRFFENKHKNYVNWFRCSGTRLIYGKSVRDAVKSNLATQRRSRVESVAPDLLRLVTNYARSKRCEHILDLTVSRAVASNPRLVSSKIPRHIQERP